MGCFCAVLGSDLALGGCHLGAGWAAECLDVAWLVGCHFSGSGLSEKGSQNTRRAKTMFTHIPNVCLLAFVAFWSTAGWPPKSRDGCHGKPQTHIFPIDFVGFPETGVPKTTNLLDNHWFCKAFQPSEGTNRSSKAGGFNPPGGTRGAHRGLSLKA